MHITRASIAATRGETSADQPSAASDMRKGVEDGKGEEGGGKKEKMEVRRRCLHYRNLESGLPGLGWGQKAYTI